MWSSNWDLDKDLPGTYGVTFTVSLQIGLIISDFESGFLKSDWVYQIDNFEIGEGWI